MRILLVFAALWTSCDLPPIPSFEQPDADVGVEADVAPPSGPVCEPNQTRCVGNAVSTCAADGRDFTIETCAAGHACSGGACVAIRNTCAAGQPFALSASELTFDVTSDLKSQTKQVSLTNCQSGPLLIRDALVRGPERPDGTAVFVLPTEFAQVFVPQGESIDLKVTYRPTAGLSHVEGKLELSLLVGELTNVEISLRSKALCAAATPALEMGIFSEGENPEGIGFLQNCGTEALTVAEIEAGPGLVTRTDKMLPFVLAAGEEIPFAVTVNSAAPLGPLDETVRFRLQEIAAATTTAVTGFVRDSECVEIPPSTPQLLVNNQPGAPRPGALLRVRFPDAPPGIAHWVRLRDEPDGSYEVATRVSDGWTVRPRIVGTYELDLFAIDVETSRVSCKSAPMTLQVRPVDPLFFELSWSADDDAVPEDLGFGHGANLDLHVLASDDDSGGWNDPERDCFPGVTGLCGAASGAISTSQSGGIPEFASFPQAEGFKFEVGAYLSNPFNFRNVRARLRVYVDGVLVSELHSDKLQSANDFWLAGIFDGTTGQWASIDSTFSGFPR